jgi:hypothetical protein
LFATHRIDQSPFSGQYLGFPLALAYLGKLHDFGLLGFVDRQGKPKGFPFPSAVMPNI